MKRAKRGVAALAASLLLTGAAAGCGGSAEGGGGGESGRGGGRGGGFGDFGGGGERPTAAVPVEVQPVERRRISSYIETNGALEAENEVDVVARVSAPIVELGAEEGVAVRRGDLLARLDPTEFEAQLEISRVALAEAEQAYDRAKTLKAENLISTEAFEQAQATFESARAQFESSRIQLGYTRIAAPFSGTIVQRYVDLAQQVSANTPLFRLSDFTPLLCPIQVPERDLSELSVGQSAFLTVEAWPDRRFDARVLRISPVVDAATGTIKVTLEVDGAGKLRPGMFASVFIETATRDDALVIPKNALALDSVEDAVYVAADGVASRRRLELGFEEGDFVEVLSGLSAGEPVVTVGQDGLSEGRRCRSCRARAPSRGRRAALPAGPAGPADPASPADPAAPAAPAAGRTWRR